MLNFLNDIGGDQNSNVPNPYYLGGLARVGNWQGLINQRHKSDEYAQQYAELKNQELENAMKTQAQIADYRKQLDEAPLLDIHRQEILKAEKGLQKPFDDLLNKYNGNIGDALSSREGRMASMQYMNGLQNAITPEMRQAAAAYKLDQDAEKSGKSIIPSVTPNGKVFYTSEEKKNAFNNGELKDYGFSGAAAMRPYDVYEHVSKQIPSFKDEKELAAWKQGRQFFQDPQQSAEIAVSMSIPNLPKGSPAWNALVEKQKEIFERNRAPHKMYDPSRDNQLEFQKIVHQDLQSQRDITNQIAKDRNNTGNNTTNEWTQTSLPKRFGEEAGQVTAVPISRGTVTLDLGKGKNIVAVAGSSYTMEDIAKEGEAITTTDPKTHQKITRTATENTALPSKAYHNQKLTFPRDLDIIKDPTGNVLALGYDSRGVGHYAPINVIGNEQIRKQVWDIVNEWDSQNNQQEGVTAAPSNAAQTNPKKTDWINEYKAEGYKP